MKKIFWLTACICLSHILSSCGDAARERANDPWVFRSVIDEQPRMVTLALNKDLWVAYRTDSCALYKVWKDGVSLDGAVYTSHHGPQPSTLGDAYIHNNTLQPWQILRGGVAEMPEVQYKGHRFEKGQAVLLYDLKTSKGEVIRVNERPEFIKREDGLIGFERTFTTENVPSGAQVVLVTNVSSVVSETSVQTEGGQFTIVNQKPRQKDDVMAQDIDGKLALGTNGETRFVTYFVKTPMVENPNKVLGKTEDIEIPEGLDLINHNDCRTCHNENTRTVGPSYKDVAARYPNNSATVKMLVQKVKNGGAGVWGQAAMTAHPTVKESDIQKMVEWIMTLDASTERTAQTRQSSGGAGDAKSAIDNLDDSQMSSGLITKVYQFNKTLFRLADLYPLPKENYGGILYSVHIEPQDFKGLEANFAIISEGYIRVPKTDNYTFRLYSDDGSRLTVDGEVIIDHDGQHGSDAKDGEVRLKEGLHRIKVEYFQSAGGKGLVFKWRIENDEDFSDVKAPELQHLTTDQILVDGRAPLPMAATKRIPGDAFPLAGVHPAFDIAQARPNDFAPMVGGMDFLPDGRLVVSTWDKIGGVYIIDNAQKGKPDQMRTKCIAKGLAEPLGLKIVNGRIFVLQKHELTELIDLDGDEEIDEYRTVCNKWQVSANFHEFAFGLAEKDGWLYGALATAILPGGASAKPQIPDRGKIFRVKIADGTFEFVARGLRTPNTVGIGIDGEIFVNDNQGDWLPSCKLMHVSPNAFFGSYSVDSAAVANMPIKQPVVWLPQDEIGNSASQMTVMKEGIYKNQMIHGEVTNGGLKRTFIEKINGEYQGCVFHFSQGFEAGINRLVWGPDGALYVGGIGNPGNWGHEGKQWFGLQRFSANGRSAFEPLAVRAKTNGVEIEFTEPLKEGMGWNIAEYDIKQWWYKPTPEYGGPKMDLENLKVLSANVSADRKRVFLEIAGIKPQHVVYVHLPSDWVSDLGHEIWVTEGYYTMNNIPTDNYGVKTTPPAQQAPNTLSAAEVKAGWQLLFDGQTMKGWRTFKKDKPGRDWVVDPNEQAIHLNVAQKGEGSFQARDGGDIITNETFENYELNLEWKIAPCGNSGIIFNVVENDKLDYVWQSGPEMQILDNVCHPDAKIDKHKAGDLYDMIACKYITVNPAGQWNKIRLIVNKGKVEQWQNGRLVVSYQMFNKQWEKLIANSKFAEMPYFGKSKIGHLALQDHGDKVWFRNIKIKRL